MSLGATFSSWISTSLVESQHVVSSEEVHCRDAAIVKIRELRDVNKLKGNYVESVLERLNSISSSGGEERLKTLIVANSHPEEQQQIKNEMLDAARFLLFPGPNFKTYVAENELEVQEHLKLIAEIDGKDPEAVDTELQNLGVIPCRTSAHELFFNFDSRKLTQIARTLLGDGTQENPGSPSLFKTFRDNVLTNKKRVELDLASKEKSRTLKGVIEDEPQVGYSRFTRNAAGTGPSEAVAELRAHFKSGQVTKSAYRKI